VARRGAAGVLAPCAASARATQALAFGQRGAPTAVGGTGRGRRRERKQNKGRRGTTRERRAWRVTVGGTGAYLAELEDRQLFLDRGFASLFEYCVAARFPRPEVRELVRRLPARAEPTLDAGCGSEGKPTEAPPREPTIPLQLAFVESPSRESSTAVGAAEAAGAGAARRGPRDGRRCSARRCLELDHVDPWAAGGESTIENLRLRCRAHNQRYARQYFGKSRVEAALRRSSRRRAASGQKLSNRERAPDRARNSSKG
jgi:hypothetical protein